MAWIESFEVTGLAGREGPVRRKLHRKVNIFWGLNGAGKTTLLKLLHAAMNNDVSDLDDLPFESAEVVFRVGPQEDMVIRRFSKQEMQLDSEDETGDVSISFELEAHDTWINSQGEEVTGWETSFGETDISPALLGRKYAHSYLPITRVAESPRRVSQVVGWQAGGSRKTSDDLFVEQVREKWRDYATKSLARIRDIQQQGLATVLAILFGGFPTPQDVRPRTESVEPREAYDLVRLFLREQGLSLAMHRQAFIERYQVSPEHREVVEEIRAVRRMTDQVLTPQRELQQVIDTMYTGNKHLVLSTPRQPRSVGMPPIRVEVRDRAIPLKSLSSGEKQLLNILLEVLGASGETVMIDEPELSLHVNWQQELVASMQRINEDCQLLLATHSPEIMADVPDEYVFEL